MDADDDLLTIDPETKAELRKRLAKLRLEAQGQALMPPWVVVELVEILAKLLGAP